MLWRKIRPLDATKGTPAAACIGGIGYNAIFVPAVPPILPWLRPRLSFDPMVMSPKKVQLLSVTLPLGSRDRFSRLDDAS